MENLIPLEKIESKILLIRNEKVMLDSDLAVLYGVTTKRLNEQVRRNLKRFPKDFMFRLTELEREILERNGVIYDCSRSQIATLKEKNGEDSKSLRSQIATSKKRGKNIKYLPYVFTEQGIAMLSGVLHSDKAVEVNIAIMRVFVNIRKFINSYEGLSRKIAEMEGKYDKKIIEIFRLFDVLMEDDKDKNRKEIGFAVS